jgi:hypothetical protein
MARSVEHGLRTVSVTNEEGKVLESGEIDLTAIKGVLGFLRGQWSLQPFGEGLSGRNGFGDVDAHTEIDGRGLVLEFKASFSRLTKGQVMKAIRQAKFQKTCTFFIEGETNEPKRIVCVNETGTEGEYRQTEVSATNMEDLIKRISEWERFAKDHSLVKGKKTGEWQEVNAFMSGVWGSPK